MYNEKKIEESLRACREIKTYYRTNVFDNPQNVFDLDTFLPLAEQKVRDNKEIEKDPDFERKLQEAIDFGLSLKRQRNSGEDESVSRQSYMTPPSEQVQTRTEETEPATVADGKVKKKSKIFVGLLEVVLCIAVAFGLATVINYYVGTYTIVDGTSMEPCLEDSDNLFVDKISYRISDPKRFDIIVFSYDPENYFIKRVIGLPGESVAITNGVISVNGVTLEEHYGAELMDLNNNYYPKTTLGADEYFVLGDNRNHSTDSREEAVGLVKRDKIIGKAIFRIYPFDQIGVLE